MAYPEYPGTFSSPSSSTVEGYMTVQTSTTVESIISSGVVPGYEVPTSSPPSGYSATAPVYTGPPISSAVSSSSTPPPAYPAPLTSTPPAYPAASTTPPAEYMVSSTFATPGEYPMSSSSVIEQIYPVAIPSPVYTSQQNQEVYGGSTPTPTSTPPAGYQTVTRKSQCNHSLFH
jgi:hypothetical protein